MLMGLIRRPSGLKSSPAEPRLLQAALTSAPATSNVNQAIRSVAQEAAGMGKEAAELVGTLEDLAALGVQQAQAFATVAAEVQGMVQANHSISHAMSASLDSAQAARDAVERVAQDVSSAATSLQQVAEAAADITKIALQTRLVAFNASVEAKRAGEAGRGFAVVADAVKDLAQKVEQSSKHIAGTVQALDQRIQELARNIRETQPINGNESFNSAFTRVEQAVRDTASAAEQNVKACEQTQDKVQGISGAVKEQAHELDAAKKGAQKFLAAGERLVELASDCGAETDDTPYIEHVIATAAAISQRFEQAIAQHELSIDDLFDDHYVKVAGSNPEQVLTRFTRFTDHVLPAFQEPMLAFSNNVVFCAAVDRNGYLPTHNHKFSKPQGADPVWNAANCRNRRIFADRTGLSAGRNQRKFLLQTYRRDMGGGKFVLMKDLSAPIFVQDRHWGGLRFAYLF